jgi:uncharacterized integral membrane protein
VVSVLVVVLAIVVAVFALQNTDRVTVRFLLWQVEQMPLAAVVLLALGAGLGIAGLPLGFQRWRLRSRVRQLESPPPAGRPAPPGPPDPR